MIDWKEGLLLGALLLSSGCKEEKVATAPPASAATATEAPRQITNDVPRAAQGVPQPKLPTLKLWVGTNELKTEIAQTLPQVMTGMMWRTNMEEMEGMLFLFTVPQQVGFWMRNTLLPLSCAYIDPQGTIVELHDMQPRDETPIRSSSDQILYVLEVKQGWFERHGVKPGMLIATERGTFPQTFQRR